MIARVSLVRAWTDVTPAQAARWLASTGPENHGPFDDAKAGRYAALMRAGQWDAREIPAVKVYTDGAVADGRHRLAAVTRAGRAQRLYVARALDADGETRISHLMLAEELHASSAGQTERAVAAVLFASADGDRDRAERALAAAGMTEAAMTRWLGEWFATTSLIGRALRAGQEQAQQPDRRTR